MHKASSISLAKYSRLALVSVFTLSIFASIIWFFGHSLGKPYTLDETDITDRAFLILRHGPSVFIDGMHYLAHPPLYEYFVALWFKCVGQSEYLLRGVGVLIYIAVGLMLRSVLNHHGRTVIASGARQSELRLPRSARNDKISSCGDVNGRGAINTSIITYAGLLLYFVNPLIIQHSILIDADTTGTSLFGMLFICLFYHWESLKGRQFLLSRIGLAIVLALMLWSKEVTPIPFATCFLIYRVFNREWKRFFADLVFSILLGFALAWGCWWLYCLYTGTDLMVFIEYTLMKKTSRVLNAGHLARSWSGLIGILRWPLFWVSAPFFIWLIMSVLRRIGAFFKTKRLQIIDIFWVVGVGVWIPYVIAKPTIDMMKYQFICYPLFIVTMVTPCLLTSTSKEQLQKLGQKWQLLVTLLIFGLITFLTWKYYHIGDYIMWQWDAASSPRWLDFLKAYYTPIIILYVLAILVGLRYRASFLRIIAITSWVLILSINLALNFNQTAIYTTTESWMNYGEYGHKDTYEYLAREMDPSRKLCVRKDIYYYLRAQKGIEAASHIELRQLFEERDINVLRDYFARGDMQFIVFDKISTLGFTPQFAKPMVDIINQNYDVVERFAHFTVYRHKRRP
ncbi:MAG: hypothetical protein ACI9CF_001777 [Candidatus Omnitrophota bacterium]|jgi:hypothetical protein